MQMKPSHQAVPAAEGSLEGQLAKAGLAVDKGIEHMLGQGLSPMAIASALLGGSMCLLARTMGDEAILHVLNNAAAGIRSGDLRDGHCN